MAISIGFTIRPLLEEKNYSEVKSSRIYLHMVIKN